MCRQERSWFEIPINGGLSHTYHSLAWDIWYGGPSILLDVLWTEERAPYILRSRYENSETVLFVVVWHQAWYDTARHGDPPPVRDSSVDQLVTRLIRHGSDVHALNSSGFTLLNEAVRLFVIYCDSSPLRSFNFAHESREVFKIERISSECRIQGSQSGSGTDLNGSTHSIWRFAQFLYWWFERLDDSDYDLNDYIRQEETLHLPVCEVGRDDAILGAKISKTFYYDKTAQRLELDVNWAWTKIEDVKGLSRLPKNFPYVSSKNMM